MRTDTLIAALAADVEAPAEAARPAAMRARLLGAAGLGLLLAGGAAAGLYGVRPDLGAAVTTAPVLLKLLGSAALGLAGLWLALRLGEPGRRLRPLAAAAPLALVALGAVALWPETRAAAWIPTWDRASLLCFLSVPLLGLAPLGGLIAGLRAGAPTRPALAGAAAGLAGGGLGAVAYALHCPIDTPGYVVTWFPAGVALAALAGALIGRRALAW